MNVKTAMKVQSEMTDYEVREEVFYGSYAHLIAAILTGRRTPPDLGGYRSRYTIPRSLPWWPEREQRKELRLKAVLKAYDERRNNKGE
jgi:hypothetical protein